MSYLHHSEKISKRCECGGELKPKITFFTYGKGGVKRYREMRENFKKEFGKELPKPTGYNCIECGRCYNKSFKKEDYSLLWLLSKNKKSK